MRKRPGFSLRFLDRARAICYSARRLKRFFLGYLIGIVPGVLLSAEPYVIAERPAWAEPATVEADKDIPTELISNGIYSLSSRRHFRIDDAAEYSSLLG